MPEIYTKPPLSIQEQITLLESRGLHIPDKSKAHHYLSFISYYRLSGYLISFETFSEGKRNHRFKVGTSFENLIELYNFDRLLRLLVMDAMERIEVAVRTQICQQMTVTYYNSHWYLRKELFKPTFNFKKFLNDCTYEFLKSREEFIRHYKKTYHTPELPPSWMMIELLSLGTWSVLYQNLLHRSDKKKISDAFDLSPIELQSWLHNLTYIRNLCAHHARLWNRHFTITPISKSKYEKYLIPNHTFAAQAAVIHIILNRISPDNEWTNRLAKLFDDHLFINPNRMGFSEGWKEDCFWKHSAQLIAKNSKEVNKDFQKNSRIKIE